ncbi:methyltransferase domain-containing protein [Mesorhizobium sp. WSM4976]|uniref:class I SAM-dependent methyltransferase n=1 Tax=Mesorhizobium sp. WSM4976 TaxID=3038549 RepID=UPI0024165A3D|nr:methyltransferase domain-containing protein [Mesorhizobium sp. WSM4976]MDG4895559.1 methyltransferase domain-containing protein [Mesorhizobium sp. WSM4976]
MITDQGQKVSALWSRLAVTADGAFAFLKDRGIAPDTAQADDLHAIDMIHMGGVAATDKLAALAGITAGQHVLDVGSGVGGPARRLASRFGADVCGIELSEALHGTGETLTRLVGLAGSVRHVRGNALSFPFEDAIFDAVIMQHVAMQIDEKDRLFAELARVIKPGGCLALHELFSGAGKIHYPLPWATEPSMSALEPIDACTSRLAGLGFTVGPFTDESEEGRLYHASNVAAYDRALAADEGALGLTVDATKVRRAASAAMEHNLASGSIKVGLLVARRVA